MNADNNPNTPPAPDASGSSPSPGAPANGPAKTLIVLMAVVLTVVLAAAMLAPMGILSAFPMQPPPTEAELIAQAFEAKGLAFDIDSFERGKATLSTTCVACHMPDGGAKPGLGKDMIHSTFTAGLDDDGLVAFLKVGRDAGDPLNTTGVGMPAKGGNPALTDDDLRDLVTFIRGRQVQEGVDF